MRTPCSRGHGPGRRRILLVAPRHPTSFWSMQGTVELFGARTLMPNAALATLIALNPPDVPMDYLLCDENVEPLDWDIPCDLVAVTGSTLHAARIEAICRGFRARRVKVALGGTFATLHPERARGLCDVLFTGEAELTWPRFLREWTAGSAAPRYEQPEPIDLTDSPAPDWSAIDVDHYIHLPVQTSRGCPNRCDFCDVIQVMGRRYRTKSVEQVLNEVRRIQALGHTSLFFSDDNFLGHRGHTLALVRALAEWNRTLRHPLAFSTQITMQVGDDDELLRALAEARFSVLFLGLETVRRPSLEEVHKGQNLSGDPKARLRRISGYGLVPFVGLIVGFDHDDATVFDELYQVLDEAPAPVAGIGLLNAPSGTPLYHRLRNEGRLLVDDFSGEWQLGSNIVPLRMTRDELHRGYWQLFRRLYEPRAFGDRLDRWLDGVWFKRSGYTNQKMEFKQFVKLARVVGFALTRADPETRTLILENLGRGLRRRPHLLSRVVTFLAQYRHFHDFVEKQGQVS